jgi:16S rRNA pseudouridine516 synthase
MSKTMHLEDILYTQGFGTRRVCAEQIEKGLVQVYLENNSSLASVFIANTAIDNIAK